MQRQSTVSHISLTQFPLRVTSHTNYSTISKSQMWPWCCECVRFCHLKTRVSMYQLQVRFATPIAPQISPSCYPFAVTSIRSNTPHPWQPLICSPSLQFWYLKVICNHTVYDLLRLAFFIQHNALDIHPSCTSLVSFLLLSTITLFTYWWMFELSPVFGYFGFYTDGKCPGMKLLSCM